MDRLRGIVEQDRPAVGAAGAAVAVAARTTAGAPCGLSGTVDQT